MSETMHTPGPWVAVRNSSFWEIRDESDFGQIGDACASSASAPNYGRSDALGEANARLMAAAPDLYEACARAEMWLGTAAGGEAMRDVMRAALAKATVAPAHSPPHPATTEEKDGAS